MMFGSAQEAHLARGYLESYGIRGTVTGDQISDTLNVYGTAVRKIELMVDAARSQEALAIVEEMQAAATASDRWDADAEMFWKCDQCEELSGPAFDECWSCGHSRPDHAERVWEKGDPFARDGSRPSELLEEDNSPYRAPMEQSVAPWSDNDRDLVNRAFRAAVLGLVFPIPMAPYGAWLCYRCFKNGQVNGRVWITLLLSIPTFAAACFVPLISADILRGIIRTMF